MDEVMITVDGTELPCPSGFTFGLQDVSLGESGRTDDAVMHKNRVAQKRKIQLEWVGLDWAQTALIMQAVNPEYIDVKYPDMLTGTYQTRTFYVGDRTAPVKFWWTDRKMLERLSFDLIER